MFEKIQNFFRQNLVSPIVQTFFQGYLKEFLPRIAGYKILLGFLLLFLYILTIILMHTGFLGIVEILNPIIDIIKTVAPEFISREELQGAVVPALIIIWGAIARLFKIVKGEPAVPVTIHAKRIESDEDDLDGKPDAVDEYYSKL